MIFRKLLRRIDRRIYPDLASAGSLHAAISIALGKIGSNLQATTVKKFIPYARVEVGHRFSQIYIVAAHRSFAIDFWANGVCFGHASSSNLIDIAKAIHLWITQTATLADMELQVIEFNSSDEGKAYEAGTFVDYQWQRLWSHWQEVEQRSPEFPTPRLLIEHAMKKPQLRQLFPFTSLDALHFSRTTGHPYTYDCPCAVPLGNGKYRAYGGNILFKRQHTKRGDYKLHYPEIIGEGSAEEVIEMLIQHLPANCGPAVEGTARDFESS